MLEEWYHFQAASRLSFINDTDFKVHVHVVAGVQ